MGVSKSWRLVALGLECWENVIGIKQPLLWGSDSNYNLSINVNIPEPLLEAKFTGFILSSMSLDFKTENWWEPILNIKQSSCKLKPFNETLHRSKNLSLNYRISCLSHPQLYQSIPFITSSILNIYPFPENITKLHLKTRINDSILKSILKFKNLNSLDLTQLDSQKGFNDHDFIDFCENVGDLNHLGLDFSGNKDLQPTCIFKGLAFLKDLKFLKLHHIQTTDPLDISMIAKICPLLTGLHLSECIVTGNLAGLLYLEDLALENNEGPVLPKLIDDSEVKYVGKWEYECEPQDPLESISTDRNPVRIGGVTQVSMQIANPFTSVISRMLGGDADSDDSNDGFGNFLEHMNFSIQHRGGMNRGDDDDNDSNSDHSSSGDGMMASGVFDGISPVEFQRIVRSSMNDTSFSDITTMLQSLMSNNMYRRETKDSTDLQTKREKSFSSRPFSQVQLFLELSNISNLKRIRLWLDPSKIQAQEFETRDLIKFVNPLKGEPQSWAQQQVLKLLGFTPNLECLELSFGYYSTRDLAGFPMSGNAAPLNAPVEPKASSSKAPVPDRLLYKKSLGVLRSLNKQLKKLTIQIDVERSKYTLGNFSPLVLDIVNLPLFSAMQIHVYLAGLITYGDNFRNDGVDVFLNNLASAGLYR